jgi:hypothetical protein
VEGRDLDGVWVGLRFIHLWLILLYFLLLSGPSWVNGAPRASRLHPTKAKHRRHDRICYLFKLLGFHFFPYLFSLGGLILICFHFGLILHELGLPEGLERALGKIRVFERQRRGRFLLWMLLS